MPCFRGSSQSRDQTRSPTLHVDSLYCLSHQESRRILEWVVYPFSRGTSWPRNWTRVSCIVGRFFSNLATSEASFILFQMKPCKIYLRVQRLNTAWEIMFLPVLLLEKGWVKGNGRVWNMKNLGVYLFFWMNKSYEYLKPHIFQGQCLFLFLNIIWKIMLITPRLSMKWSCSGVSNSATAWTVGHQAPASMGFPRQEYWNGLPFPSPGDLPDLEIKPWSPALQADTLTSEPPGSHKTQYSILQLVKHIFFLIPLHCNMWPSLHCHSLDF